MADPPAAEKSIILRRRASRADYILLRRGIEFSSDLRTSHDITMPTIQGLGAITTTRAIFTPLELTLWTTNGWSLQLKRPNFQSTCALLPKLLGLSEILVMKLGTSWVGHYSLVCLTSVLRTIQQVRSVCLPVSTPVRNVLNVLTSIHFQ